MGNLKTLEDFWDIKTGTGKAFLNEEDFARQLKQEAIKWVKMGQARIDSGEFKDDKVAQASVQGAISSFKHFFNIEAGDLK